MRSIIKTSKRGVIAILTLCMFLGIAGTCVNVAAMAEKNTIATEEKTAVTEETTPELMPMMARGCPSGLGNFLNKYASEYNYEVGEIRYGHDIPLSGGILLSCRSVW